MPTTDCTILLLRLQHGHERLLGDVHAADGFHALLALLLLLQQLALAGHVAAVALGGHVLAEGLERLAGDDLGADRGLERDLELVAVDLAAELDQEAAPAGLGLAAVADQ